MSGTAGRAAEAAIRAARPEDLPRLRDILNTEILTSTASWTTSTRTDADMAAWFNARVEAGYPVIVALSPGRDQIAGYASYGPFRKGEGYAGTVEHSVYVHHDFRGRGIAAGLVRALLDRAAGAGLRLMIGGISADATTSLKLHRRLGFREVGRIPGAGRKFGRALDLVLMARAPAADGG